MQQSWIGLGISCALVCVGTSRAKSPGFTPEHEGVYFCSVWQSAHVVLGMRCICCIMGMWSGFAVELSGLNMGSVSFINVDEISI